MNRSTSREISLIKMYLHHFSEGLLLERIETLSGETTVKTVLSRFKKESALSRKDLLPEKAHFENTPVHIYCTFYNQERKIFR